MVLFSFFVESVVSNVHFVTIHTSNQNASVRSGRNASVVHGLVKSISKGYFSDNRQKFDLVLTQIILKRFLHQFTRDTDRGQLLQHLQTLVTIWSLIIVYTKLNVTVVISLLPIRSLLLLWHLWDILTCLGGICRTTHLNISDSSLIN